MDAEGNSLVEEQQHGGRERESLQESVQVGECGEKRGGSAGRLQERAEKVGGIEVQVFLLEAGMDGREKVYSLMDG